MSAEEQAARTALQGLIADQFNRPVRELAEMALATASVSGICPCKILLTTTDQPIPVPDGKPPVYAAVLLITAPMADEDLRRFSHFAQGFIQDIGTGFPMSKRTHTDTISEGGAST